MVIGMTWVMFKPDKRYKWCLNQREKGKWYKVGWSEKVVFKSNEHKSGVKW